MIEKHILAGQNPSQQDITQSYGKLELICLFFGELEQLAHSLAGQTFEF